MKKSKVLDIVFIVLLALFGLIVLLKFILAPYGVSSSFKALIELSRYPLIIFAIIHAIYTLGKKSILFFALAFLIPLGSELSAVYAGLDRYTSVIWGPRVLGKVPLVIPLQWVAYIYVAYCIANYIFSQDRRNPRPAIIFLISFAVGLNVMAIDIGHELVAVNLGQWVWLHGGKYFGVPLSNFAGWFLIPLIVTFIFLLYETRTSKGSPSKTYFLPVIAYFILLLNTTSEALAIKHPEYALLSAACMLPFVIIPLLVASRTWKNKEEAEAIGNA